MLRIDAGTGWGPAEQEALDRCLSASGLSDRSFAMRAPLRLSRTIETEIIPRLLLAHLPRADEHAEGGTLELTYREVGEFTRVVLECEMPGVLAHLEALRARGHALEALFLHLFAPTARLLGDMWRDDLCTFTDVTIGLSRLQQALRELSPSFEAEARPQQRGRILLAPMPGDQHSFGLSMLETFFRRGGWDVCGGAVHSRTELAAIARDEWLDAIGLSLANEVLYSRLRPLIRALRKASRNPSLFVMVGGPYFNDHPDRALDAGADTGAADAPDALRRADAGMKFAIARC
jgi:methanogenic corrinoid protein MtbC1